MSSTEGGFSSTPESPHQQGVDESAHKDSTTPEPNQHLSMMETSPIAQADTHIQSSELSAIEFAGIPQTATLPSTTSVAANGVSPSSVIIDETDGSMENTPRPPVPAPPEREVIDLTDDEPYVYRSQSPKSPVVKPEPNGSSSIATSDDVMVGVEPEITNTLSIDSFSTPDREDASEAPEHVDPDAMEIDTLSHAEQALPSVEHTDPTSSETNLQDGVDGSGATMLMLQTAALQFQASLATKHRSIKNEDVQINNFEDPEDHIDPDAEDSDANDAAEVAKFEIMKNEYLKKKKAGVEDFAEDLEFKRLEQAESERRRLRARNNASHASAEIDDQSMFVPDNEPHSPSVPTGSVDEDFTSMMLMQSEDQAPVRKGAKRGRPRGSKNKATGRVQKLSKKGKEPGGREESRNMANFESLLNNDLIATAQQNQTKESQPTFTNTTKGKALAELISSMPKEQQKLHRTDKEELLKATKKFKGRGAMKADGAGGWRLKGMKSSLHHYQLLGVAFMRDLETRPEKPFGGFVSDDMGFGKTVMAICNMVDGRASPRNMAKATLVVAPSSLLTQWMNEIQKHAEPSVIGRVLLYRTGSSFVVSDIEDTLGTMGVVITSYHEVLRSFPKNDPPPELCTERAKAEWWANQCETNIGPLHRVKWRRIILDEAQAIKNHLSRTSQAVCHLKSKFRWAISGTPIQNRLEEFYAYFKFLDLPQTGSYETFRQNFCKRESKLALDRLRQYISQFMLRRTHGDTLFGRPLLKLPPVQSTTTFVEFNIIEKSIYRIVKDRFVQKIRAFVRRDSAEKKYQSIFVLLLRLRQLTCHCFLVQETFKDLLEEADLQKLWKLTENEEDPKTQRMIEGLSSALANVTADVPQPPDQPLSASPVVFRFRKYLLSMREDGKWNEITDKTMCTLCKDHPTEPHITSCGHIYCLACLNNLKWKADMEGQNKGPQCLECLAHFDRTEKISREDLMVTDSSSPFPSCSEPPKKGPAADAEEGIDWLNIGGPILQSAKTRAATLQIQKWRAEDPTAKVIVFTQFRGMIKVMKRVCDENKWDAVPFHGSMSFDARDKAVQRFTEEPDCFVMLCGLKAGGVGLNLTAATRVLIVDLWWNQFVETQAFCRVYRIGQDRPVEMVRLVVKNSIDEDIVSMQEKKNVEINSAVESKNHPGRLSARELVQLFASELELNADGEPVLGPHEEPFIFTNDPFQTSSIIEDVDFDQE